MKFWEKKSSETLFNYRGMQYRGTDIAKQTGTYNTSGPEILAVSINLGSILLLDRARPRLFLGPFKLDWIFWSFLIWTFISYYKRIGTLVNTSYNCVGWGRIFSLCKTRKMISIIENEILDLYNTSYRNKVLSNIEYKL